MIRPTHGFKFKRWPRVPHFGRLAAELGTMRGDGVVAKIENSLYVTPQLPLNAELREDGSYELREDGSVELRN